MDSAAETDEAALAAMESWEPEQLLPDNMGGTARLRPGMANAVSMLVALYGSKDLFIAEYW